MTGWDVGRSWDLAGCRSGDGFAEIFQSTPQPSSPFVFRFYFHPSDIDLLGQEHILQHTI
jgi:hypothetical protein